MTKDYPQISLDLSTQWRAFHRSGAPDLYPERLFTTLVRFDAVSHGHFMGNRQKLTEFPNLWRYARDLFAHNGVGDTVDFDHI